MTDILELVRGWNGEDVRDMAALLETVRDDPAVSDEEFYSVFYETARKFPGINDGVLYDDPMGELLVIGDTEGMLLSGNVGMLRECISFETFNPGKGGEV